MYKYETTFQKTNDVAKRTAEVEKILAKYPDRIPVVVEKRRGSHMKDIDKHKYLVPISITFGQFIHVIRKRVSLRPEEALYVFVNGELVSASELISAVYMRHKDPSGFLVCVYCEESTFGGFII